MRSSGGVWPQLCQNRRRIIVIQVERFRFSECCYHRTYFFCLFFSFVAYGYLESIAERETFKYYTLLYTLVRSRTWYFFHAHHLDKIRQDNFFVRNVSSAVGNFSRRPNVARTVFGRMCRTTDIVVVVVGKRFRYGTQTHISCLITRVDVWKNDFGIKFFGKNRHNNYTLHSVRSQLAAYSNCLRTREQKTDISRRRGEYTTRTKQTLV